jgi:hypothetical protein
MVVNYQSIAQNNNDSIGGDDDDDDDNRTPIVVAPAPSYKRVIAGIVALGFLLLTLNVNGGLGQLSLNVNTLMQKIVNRIDCRY